MYKLLAQCVLSLAVMGIVAARSTAADNVTDSVGVAHHCRVSKIEGLKVRNPAGDDLGKIKDLVIDIKSGKIAYAALDFGGFLGLGDKMFAVPWSAFSVQGSDKDAHLVLNVSKEGLKDAPGFDKNHWPELANPNWATEVDRFYTPQRTTGRSR